MKIITIHPNQHLCTAFRLISKGWGKNKWIKHEICDFFYRLSVFQKRMFFARDRQAPTAMKSHSESLKSFFKSLVAFVRSSVEKMWLKRWVKWGQQIHAQWYYYHYIKSTIETTADQQIIKLFNQGQKGLKWLPEAYTWSSRPTSYIWATSCRLSALWHISISH